MSTKTPDRKPTFSHRLEYAAARGALALLKLVNWKRSSAIGGRIAQFVYKPVGIRSGVVERQIAAAFPDLTNEQVISLARRSYDSLGRTSIESALLSGASTQEIISRFDKVDGWHHVEDALAKNKGLILVTGHLGNWELAGAYFAARGTQIDVVARGMANPLFDAFVMRTREGLGMTVVHDSEAVRKTPRSLRDNHVVGFVSDHDALGLASTFVPFFGRPAKTPRGPAVFALRFESPVVFMSATRNENGLYDMYLRPVEVNPTGDREADTDRIVLTFTEMLEERIRLFPEQYFWQHRRWRRQPPDTPPHLREP